MRNQLLKVGKEIAEQLTISFFIASIVVLVAFFGFGKSINTYIGLFNMMAIGESQTKAQELKFDSVKKRLAVYPGWKTVWATIEIPKIGVSAPIYQGDTLDIIRYGVGHYSGSYFPGEGASILLAAHNSSEHFMYIPQLVVGDEIIIRANYGTFRYKVVDGRLIHYQDSSQLPIQTDKELLMMYTCWPVNVIGFKTRRYVIYAELVGEEYA